MTYCSPFPQGTPISQEFGTNPGGFNPSGGHTGRDYKVDVGTPVHAGGDGVIEYAGAFDDTYADNLLWLINYGGNTIVLNCGDAEPTFNYAHLSQFLVKTGDRVSKGQVIALSGNSGAATTGPHCHVEEMFPGYSLSDSTYGRSMPVFDEYPENISVQSAPATLAPAPAPINLTAKDNDMALVLIKAPGNDAIWIGNFIERRQVPDVATLQDIQYRHQTGEITIINNGSVIEGNVEMAGKAV